MAEDQLSYQPVYGGGPSKNELQYGNYVPNKYSQIIPQNNPAIPDLKFGDFNGDGVTDLLYRWSFSTGHGGPTWRIVFNRGFDDGHFEHFKTIVFSLTSRVHTVIGDWDNDGIDEIFLYENPFGFHMYSVDGTDIREQSLTFPSQIYNFVAGVAVGDYNADEFPDILGQFYSSGNEFKYHATGALLTGNGDGTFRSVLKDFPITSPAETADFNRDGIGDVVMASRNELKLHYGATDATTALIATDTIAISFTPTLLYVVDFNEDDKQDIYIASATEYQFLFSTESLTFETAAVDLPNAVSPQQILFHDLNHDQHVDLLSWENENLFVALGNGKGQFELATTIQNPFIDNIYIVHVTDMDRDGKKDILVFQEKDESVTFLNRPATPTSIFPLPTATPTPTISLQPTPTPIRAIPNAMEVNTEANMQEVLNQAPDNTTLLLKPGTYEIPDTTIRVINKTITLIGKGQREDTILSGQFELNNCSVTIQNITFIPSPKCFTYFTVTNSNLTLIHTLFQGTISVRNYYNMFSADGGPTILYQNGFDNSLTLIDNIIEPGSLSTNLQISNCLNCTIRARDNPMFGNSVDNAQLVVNSSKLRLFLPKNMSKPSLMGIQASTSTIEVFNGWIHGRNGDAGVRGKDGLPAITAESHSTVILHEISVTGGRGGKGIIPGQDANPLIRDESSWIGWDTSISSWYLY